MRSIQAGFVRSRELWLRAGAIAAGATASIAGLALVVAASVTLGNAATVDDVAPLTPPNELSTVEYVAEAPLFGPDGDDLFAAVGTDAPELLQWPTAVPPTSTPEPPTATATLAPAPTPTSAPARPVAPPQTAPQAPPPPPPPPPTATAAPPTPTPQPPVSSSLDTSPMDAYSAALFEATNRRRASQGLPPLRANGLLVGIARIRANEMAQYNYFAHESPITGHNAFTLMEAHGVPFAWGGENLAKNNYPDSETVAVADEALWNSAPHRENILLPNYTDMGIALAVDANGVKYFAIIFTGP